MIVLDTNVLSELGREKCDAAVRNWIDDQNPRELWITSTTISELVLGVMQMPEGRRRNAVDDANAKLVSLFYDRTLDFDGNAAIEYGRFLGDQIAEGHPMSRGDAQIAASCISSSAAIATRNVKDFDGIPGLEVINPWDYGR